MPNKIQKFINSLDQKTKTRLTKRIFLLKESPYKGSDVKKLKGFNALYRLRLGKIRVIFKFNNATVEIVDINYRGNIY